MSTTLVTLEGDASDALGIDFKAAQTKVHVRYNTDIVGTDDGYRLGSAKQSVNEDGTFVLENVVASTDAVANLLATVVVDYVDRVAQKHTYATFGPYDLSGESGTVNLRDIDAVQYLDASRASVLMSEMEALRDQQVELSGIDDSDSAQAYNVKFGPLSKVALEGERQGTTIPARVPIANAGNALAHGDPTDSFTHKAVDLADRSANATFVPSGIGSRFAYRLMAGGSTLTDLGTTFDPPPGWQKFRIVAEMGRLDATSGSYWIDATISAVAVGGSYASGDVTLMGGATVASAQGVRQDIVLGSGILVTPGASYHLRFSRNAAAASDTAGDMGLVKVRFERQFPALNLVWDGNSLVIGQGSSAGYDMPNQATNYIDTLINGYVGATYITADSDSSNLGVGGQTTGAMIADGVAQVDALFNSTPNAYRDQIVVCWEGTNDLWLGSGSGGVDTPQDAYDNLSDYCLARRTAGFKVVVGTILPRQNTGTPSDFETKRRELNEMLRTGWPDFADALADVAAHPALGQVDSPLDTTYYNADKVHLTNTGYGAAARIFVDAIRSVAA